MASWRADSLRRRLHRRVTWAADWLLLAQQVHGTGGYAHSYTVGRGWAAPYPETTGYIIPTLLRVSRSLDSPHYAASARCAAEWLLPLQTSDGGFTDLDGRKQVFDTGQVLEGMLSMYQETSDHRFAESARAAAAFIVASQDQDGTWTHHAYRERAHTYYTRVAASLLSVDAVLSVPEAARSAHAFLDWALSQVDESGYFSHMEFNPGSLPYLHTIIYVLEGLEASFHLTGDPALREALERTTDALLATDAATRSVPEAQYDADWRSPRRERCLTGAAQWVALLARLERLVPGAGYRQAADRGMRYLLSRQLPGSLPRVGGALFGSDPPWGTYFRFAVPNWGVKFLLDALLDYEALCLDG